MKLPLLSVALEERGSAATIATPDAGLPSTGLVSSVTTVEATIQIRCLLWWAVRRRQSASSGSNNCSQGSMTLLVTRFYWMLALVLEHLPPMMVIESIALMGCRPRLRTYTQRLQLHSAVHQATTLSVIPVAPIHHVATSSSQTSLAAPPSQHHASQHQACPTCPT